MATTLTQTVLFDSEDVQDLTNGADFTVEDIFGKPFKVSNLPAKMIAKTTAVDIQNLLNIGQRVDQVTSNPELGSATVKEFDSSQYDLSGDYPPITAFNALVDLYNTLAKNYNAKIQYELDNRLLNAYPLSN